MDGGDKEQLPHRGRMLKLDYLGGKRKDEVQKAEMNNEFLSQSKFSWQQATQTKKKPIDNPDVVKQSFTRFPVLNFAFIDIF